MSKSRFIRANSRFVGIRKSGSCSVEPDTDKHEKDSTHAIDLEVLKAIRRTVLAIKKRIDARGNFGNDSQPCAAGNPSSSKTDGPNSGEDFNSEAAENT
jgi:hypothetical protein